MDDIFGPGVFKFFSDDESAEQFGILTHVEIGFFRNGEEYHMNWVRALAAMLVLWSSTAGGATLTWQANSEPDLAGYRVYRCNQQPCTQSSGNAALLATLGTGTSFNIGTPAVVQYYFITAFDFTNHESGNSNLAIFTPIGSPPAYRPMPSPLVGTVSLQVVGNPATGPWGVEASTTDPRNVMVSIGFDGVGHHIKHTPPYGFPGDNGITVTTGRFGPWSHFVEFVFYVEGTTIEIGRASITVLEGSPSPSPMGKISLKVVGNPASGPWGVEASTPDPRNVMVSISFDGLGHHIKHTPPYSFPGDNGTTATTGRFGPWPHKVEFVFYVEGTTTEIGRASMTIPEGTW